MPAEILHIRNVQTAERQVNKFLKIDCYKNVSHNNSDAFFCFDLRYGGRYVYLIEEAESRRYNIDSVYRWQKTVNIGKTSKECQKKKFRKGYYA